MRKFIKYLLVGMLTLSLVACQQEAKESTIHVYTRDSSSGTREAFEGAIGFADDDELTLNASEASSNGDMAKRVGQDLDGIGYVSMSTDFVANNIKPLMFEGVKPSVETTLDASYKMQRPFNYVTRASGDFESEEVEELVKAFIAFISESEEGLAAIEDAGGIVDYSNAKPWQEIASNFPVLKQDNSSITLRTGGSTSVEKTIKSALEAFSPLAGNVGFSMNQSGSSDGYKRVLGNEKDGANAVEIGFASRPFKESEDVSKAMASGSFCKDAVVVVVNADNQELNDISSQDLKEIYLGTVTSFKDIQ